MKKLILLALIIAAVFGFGGYRYYQTTATYSLNLIRESVENHDWHEFSKRVDVDTILNDGLDEIIYSQVESDSLAEKFTRQITGGFVQMLKPSIVEKMKTDLQKTIQTVEEKAGIIVEDKDEPNNFKKRFEFGGIESADYENDLANVRIKIHDNLDDRDMFIELQMIKLDDGTWKVSKVSNLNEILKGVKNQ